jgi:hypothetical protein
METERQTMTDEHKIELLKLKHARAIGFAIVTALVERNKDNAWGHLEGAVNIEDEIKNYFEEADKSPRK